MFLDGALQAFSHRTRSDVEGRKEPLTDARKAQLLRSMPHLSAGDLDGYFYERHGSTYPDAEYDIFIFNDEGRPIIEGREFGRQAAFWQSTARDYQKARFY